MNGTQDDITIGEHIMTMQQRRSQLIDQIIAMENRQRRAALGGYAYATVDGEDLTPEAPLSDTEVVRLTELRAEADKLDYIVEQLKLRAASQ